MFSRSPWQVDPVCGSTWNVSVNCVAKCQVCTIELSTASSQTTGLKHHLDTRHTGDVTVKADNSQKSVVKFCACGNTTVSHSQSSKITELIGHLITDNMLPVGTVNLPAFVALMNYLEHSDKVPCHQNMMAALEAKKEEVQIGLLSYK